MSLPPVDRSLNMPSSVSGVELASTGVAAAAKVRPVVTNEPTESTVLTVSGQAVANPDRPSNDPEQPNKDWTEVKAKATTETPPEPPKEPIFKQLLEHIQSMWRASATAVDLAQATSQAEAFDLMKRQQASDQLLVYSDPKVKRSGNVE